jgi:hypothetical protein
MRRIVQTVKSSIEANACTCTKVPMDVREQCAAPDNSLAFPCLLVGNRRARSPQMLLSSTKCCYCSSQTAECVEVRVGVLMQACAVCLLLAVLGHQLPSRWPQLCHLKLRYSTLVAEGQVGINRACSRDRSSEQESSASVSDDITRFMQAAP